MELDFLLLFACGPPKVKPAKANGLLYSFVRAVNMFSVRLEFFSQFFLPPTRNTSILSSYFLTGKSSLYCITKKVKNRPINLVKYFENEPSQPCFLLKHTSRKKKKKNVLSFPLVDLIRISALKSPLKIRLRRCPQLVLLSSQIGLKRRKASSRDPGEGVFPYTEKKGGKKTAHSIFRGKRSERASLLLFSSLLAHGGQFIIWPYRLVVPSLFWAEGESKPKAQRRKGGLLLCSIFWTLAQVTQGP